MSPRDQTKRRGYDDERDFLCNYKTVVGKEQTLQYGIDAKLKEGILAVPFYESELRVKFQKSLLNSLGGKYPTKPDVSTLVGATRGGVNQHIRPTMQPTRLSLADSLRLLYHLNIRPIQNPTGGRRNGRP